MLKPTKDRIVASSVTSSWKYSQELPDYQEPYAAIKKALVSQLFGPPEGGVYSPSVQYTLFQMGKAAIADVDAVESIYIKMPNIHFLPCSPVNTEGFENDVYVATSEPYGTIETTITRGAIAPHVTI